MNINLRNICFSLCLCLTAALASAAPFTSPHGYRLTLPTGWHAVPNQGTDDAHLVTAAATDGTVPSVVIKIVPVVHGMTMADLKPALLPVLKKSFPGATFLSQSSSTLGGVPDLDLIFVEAQRGGKKIRLRQIYAVKNNSAYIFTAGYSESTHAKYDTALAQMLSSFHWKS